MRDVALRAGVGVGTVSRVVNGGVSVRPVTAERVLRAIEELGFHRNDVARALRPGMTSTTIALLLGDLTNPFYAAIARSALDVARDAGYAVMLSSVDEDAAAEQGAVRQLFSRGIAGMMLVPVRRDTGFLQRALRSETPIVLIDRPAHGVETDAVLVDNDKGGFLATRHLIDHGHKRVAMLVAPSYYTTGQRTNGYRRALRSAGLRVDPELIVQLEHGTVADAEAATRELLARRRRPTAIFASTNFLCEGALRALGPGDCRSRRRRVRRLPTGRPAARPGDGRDRRRIGAGTARDDAVARKDRRECGPGAPRSVAGAADRTRIGRAQTLVG